MSLDPLQLIELMKHDIEDVRRDLKKIEDGLDQFKQQYTKEVVQNINAWNGAASNQNRVVWIVVTAVIAGVLTLVGLQ